MLRSATDLEVGDLMTKSAVSARASDSLDAVAKLMWDHDCGVIPLLEHGSERVVGVVTDRDICMATWSRNLAPSAILASEVMSRDLVYCSPHDTVRAAETIMRTRQVRRLPVLDSGSRLLGILSITDITRVAGQRSAVRPGYEISPEQVVDTLARITSGRFQPAPREANPIREW